MWKECEFLAYLSQSEETDHQMGPGRSEEFFLKE